MSMKEKAIRKFGSLIPEDAKKRLRTIGKRIRGAIRK
jgi:hypothetical protein